MKIIKPSKVGFTLVSVDLGAKGAIVWNDKDELKSQPISTTPRAIAMDIYNLRPMKVVAEDVRSWQAFSGSLMIQRGVLVGICAAFNISGDFVDPKDWMKCFTHHKKDNFKTENQWKKHLIAIAEEAFKKKKLSSGEADAMMLWNYYASIIVNDRMRPIGEFQFT